MRHDCNDTVVITTALIINNYSVLFLFVCSITSRRKKNYQNRYWRNPPILWCAKRKHLKNWPKRQKWKKRMNLRVRFTNFYLFIHILDVKYLLNILWYSSQKPENLKNLFSIYFTCNPSFAKFSHLYDYPKYIFTDNICNIKRKFRDTEIEWNTETPVLQYITTLLTRANYTI